MKLELRETRKQGTSLHPLKIYGMQDINGKIDVPYHWQETVEILWIQCGRLSLMIKETLYEGKQGDIFYVNPCELHGMRSLTGDCMYLAFIFPLSWFRAVKEDETEELYVKPLEEGSVCIEARLPARTAEHVVPIFQEIYELYENGGNGAWLGIKAGLLRFYYCMYRDNLTVRRQKDSGEMDMRLKISRYIEKHCNEPISLKSMGKEFHMSPKYFSTYFQKHFARNFSDYVMAVRVEKAKRLLSETDGDMELVAQQSGFSSSSYFIRVFRQVLGMTPGQYRKKEVFPE
ncbi:MAG: AraC family transcriptional regulator [Hungatella sp.]|nr:AraC family transcriptional regulator [Hungatella sp.]